LQLPRGENVIPARTDVVGRQREFLQLSFCNFATLSVDPLIKMSFHLQSGGCCRAPDEREHDIEIAKRLACPVHADVAKKPVTGFHLEHAGG
jgi:hypothetical protein